ncbi:Uncharacterised protein [Mycobacteroides abscessus]|nr:Uncharacterised protein [Mycobacteroides abscessus]
MPGKNSPIAKLMPMSTTICIALRPVRRRTSRIAPNRPNTAPEAPTTGWYQASDVGPPARSR